MSDEFPSRLLEKVVVRLPDGVRDMLKLAADVNKRSMNAEIVARLLDTLEPWKPGDPIEYISNKEFYTDIGSSSSIDEVLARLEAIVRQLKAPRRDHETRDLAKLLRDDMASSGEE